MTETEKQAVAAALFQSLKLPAAYAEFQRQLSNPDCMDMDFTDRVTSMLQTELDQRHERRIARLLRESKIDDAMPHIDRLIFNESRNLKKSFIMELAQCHWITSPQHPWLLITGRSGTGKTWLSKALLRCAIEHGHTGLYVKLRTLLDQIDIARDEKKAGSLVQFYSRKEVLLIDDFNSFRTEPENIGYLQDIFVNRYARAATIITSQYPAETWYSRLSTDNDVKDAIMDRIANGSHEIKLSGRSLRENRSLGLNNETKETNTESQEK